MRHVNGVSSTQVVSRTMCSRPWMGSGISNHQSVYRQGLLALLCASLLVLASSPVKAELFVTIAESGVDSFTADFDNVDDAFDQLTTEKLQEGLPSYTDQSAATAVINYRGLPMNFTFNANSPFLTLTIPELGVSETFEGATRDESKELLVEYLEGAGADTVNRIQKELARVSPVDPVAGNPSSLMGNMVSSNFSHIFMAMTPMEFAATEGGFDLLSRTLGPSKRSDVLSADRSGASGGDSASNMDNGGGMTDGMKDSGGTDQGMSDDEAKIGAWSENSLQGGGSSLGIDVSHAEYDLDGTDAETQTIVVDYLYQFADPLKIIRVSMPVAVTDTEGAKSYQVNAGVSYSHPLTRSWSITPGLSYGAAGSEDLGGGASINGISLSSTYRLVYGNYLYKMGNMVARYQTGSVSIGDYEIDPDISNTVLRNGLMVMRPTMMFDIPSLLQVFAIDTRFSGDELYTEHYYELGFALGMITSEDLLAEDNFHLGFTYLDSTDSDIKGYKINFGFDF